MVRLTWTSQILSFKEYGGEKLLLLAADDGVYKVNVQTNEVTKCVNSPRVAEVEFLKDLDILLVLTGNVES